MRRRIHRELGRGRVIDLGTELADYGDEPRRPGKLCDIVLPDKAEPWQPQVHKSRTTPLRDLEKQGFNTTPPPGFQLAKDIRNATDEIEKQLFKDLGEPMRKMMAAMDVKISAKTWLGAAPADFTPDNPGFHPVGAIHDDASSWSHITISPNPVCDHGTLRHACAKCP